MANNPGNSDKFRAAGREKFDLNLRSHLEICHGKQTHADVAQIDTKTIQLGRLGEYLHGSVQQLAFPASPVWFEAPFEDHLSTGKDTVAKRSLRAKITNVQWNVERLFNRYLGLSKTGSKIGLLMPGFPMVRLDSRGFGVFGSFAKCGLA
jgi:hypothetical protein